MQKCAHLNRDVKKWGHSYTNQEKMGHSYSFLVKRGLNVYLAALKKGAIRAAHPYHVIYRELPPPVTPPPPRLTTDRRLTEWNLSSELGITKSTVHRTFKDDFHTDL